MNKVEKQYVVGVDVGTGSARAGVFDLLGNLMGTAKREITVFSDRNARYEQSSAEIWASVCHAVRSAVEQSGIDARLIIGLSFDATCSMVVIGPDGEGLPVGEHNQPSRDVIVWMDQRATGQAERINDSGHSVLEYVGSRISPEMQTPKLLWLKENLTETYNRASHFFDLTDFLTWKASGSLARSVCTTVCKWTYLAHEQRWDASYFEHIGLDDLADQGFRRIGIDVVAPGTPLGAGLTEEAAGQLNLPASIAVGAGMIDAHAGGIGTVGAANADGKINPLGSLAYVFGTSACTLMSSKKKITVPGVWGPYYAAMLSDVWLNEAGQSAAGAAIDHLVTLHPAYPEVQQQAATGGLSPVAWLSSRVKSQVAELSDAVDLARSLHVVPEFLGNRAPFADPGARGCVVGLTMDSSIDSLMALYVAGLCGLAYGLRQIIDAQSAQGIVTDRIVISGGAGQDPLVRQILADATQLDVLAPQCDEPVLLGSAILAALAAGAYPTLTDAMQAMSAFGERYTPATGQTAQSHAHRYKAFARLQAVARELRLQDQVAERV